MLNKFDQSNISIPEIERLKIEFIDEINRNERMKSLIARVFRLCTHASNASKTNNNNSNNMDIDMDINEIWKAIRRKHCNIIDCDKVPDENKYQLYEDMDPDQGIMAFINHPTHKALDRDEIMSLWNNNSNNTEEMNGYNRIQPGIIIKLKKPQENSEDSEFSIISIKSTDKKDIEESHKGINTSMDIGNEVNRTHIQYQDRFHKSYLKLQRGRRRYNIIKAHEYLNVAYLNDGKDYFNRLGYFSIHSQGQCISWF